MLSWGKLVAICAGLATAFMVAEVGLRLAQPIPPHQLLPFPYKLNELRRFVNGTAGYFRFDAQLGWSLAPNWRIESDGVLSETNEAGLRAEREYPPEPPPGVRRLAAFGDSFVHCDEVNLEDCWTSGLEEAWPGTEVLNFGVPVYGPDQAWLRYERDGRAYRPCAVLIGYMVENINRVVNRFRPFYIPEANLILSKPRFVPDGDGLRLLPNPVTGPAMLADPRRVEAMLGPDDYWYFPGTFVANPLDVSYVVRVVRTAAYRRHIAERGGIDYYVQRFDHLYRVDQEAYQVAGRVLIQFARRVRQDGATPVVVVFARQAEVLDLRDRGVKVHQPLLDWLGREGIPAIDVTDRLAAEAQRIDVDALFASRGHYNKEGNGLVAATLARRLPELTAATCAVQL
jgi:hypothetical protein